jgi:hypothetical protein
VLNLSSGGADGIVVVLVSEGGPIAPATEPMLVGFVGLRAVWLVGVANAVRGFGVSFLRVARAFPVRRGSSVSDTATAARAPERRSARAAVSRLLTKRSAALRLIMSHGCDGSLA